ncbi:MAG: hypothetical protein AUG44_09450 [Actinobacteria bacterium 13_1_20CM_3_71_11]|nr:MAG: hypothetical protein AUG44_09450 [Actinobacteria bacterium 13_1_20CM_3_71_11]
MAEPMRVLDSSRIRWGRVTSVHNGHAVVSSAPLCWTGRELILGAPRPEQVRVSVAASVGDTVALQWNWVCDVLDTRQATALRHYTVSQLRVANRALRRPVADLVLR